MYIHTYIYSLSFTGICYVIIKIRTYITTIWWDFSRVYEFHESIAIHENFTLKMFTKTIMVQLKGNLIPARVLQV